jgi:cell division protein FtsB
MPLTSSIISIVKNKYLIAITAFSVIVLFFDHNNFFEQIGRKQELKELQAKKQYYLDEIEKARKELADLSNNPATIEKYAREHFQMKRDNEDIFIVEKLTDSLKNTP